MSSTAELLYVLVVLTVIRITQRHGGERHQGGEQLLPHGCTASSDKTVGCACIMPGLCHAMYYGII